MSNIELIKAIRYKTGLSLNAIKKAITETNSSDEEVIIKHMREQGVLKAQARSGRSTENGMIFTYVHEGRLGVMLEVKCETDFVARSDSFNEFGADLTLHIAAYQPEFVSPEDVSQDFIDKELEIMKAQMESEGKPMEVITKILDGKKNKIVKEVSLLSQPFLKNPEITVQEYLDSIRQTTGEHVQVSRFVTYNLNS